MSHEPEAEPATAAPSSSNVGLLIDRVSIGRTIVRLPPRGVTAVVGGNNVGKSTVLRELANTLALHPGHDLEAQVHPILVRDLHLEHRGSAEDVVAWLQETAHYTPQQGDSFATDYGASVPRGQVAHQWGHPDRLGFLNPFMVHYSEPMAREAMLGPTGLRSDINEPPTHPLQALADDAALLAALNEICVRVFRVELTLDRLSGNLMLRIGRSDVEAPPVDAVTAEYRESLASLPVIMQQGQGMKSMLGLLLPVIAATRPIILIDEPEAFLHPPQAFELGRILASLANERGLQVILATHDRNLLTGLLEPGAPVSVVRLDRVGDTTTASQLDAADLTMLWNDPVLRYSNVLDGVFHRVVILAEGDRDCRFYAAGLDAMNGKEQMAYPPSEVLWVPSGGKDGMPKIARALAAVNVRVVASPDFDILDDEAKLRRLVEAFGGAWAEFVGDYRASMNEFRPRDVDATCGDVLDAVRIELEPVATEPWTRQRKERLRPMLRSNESRMGELKRYGIRSFHAGGAPRAIALLDRLEALGICPLREGELERLAPAVGVAKGPAWLTAALEAGAHESAETTAHLEHLLASAAGSTPA